MKTLKIKTVDISQRKNYEVEDIIKNLEETQEGIFFVRGSSPSLTAFGMNENGIEADISIIPVCYGNGKETETNVDFRNVALKDLYHKYTVLTGKHPAKSWDRSKTFLKWLEQIDYIKTDYVILNTSLNTN